MSIEGIIDKLEEMATDREGKILPGCLGYDEIEPLRDAIALLRTHPEAQPNEPLTLEELREMDGQPVWTHSDIFPGDCGWRVVKKAGVLHAEFTDGRFFALTDYEKSWTAYRRLPKED